ncbi:hypothetical protein HS088_TW07G00345 [Tripterygium wilfordii]|uniref:Nonsense-mediated mRNA decay factor SMG8 n=1 Tax=Tripterygium wilfordii TaxID=458696 RepID=A0A7J7DFC9_TRIWF|nr:hypothetical protein HS088_TW07G00345 [Tripterygium wilfordii]
MDVPRPPSMRVLTRPPVPSPTPTHAPSPEATPSPATASPSLPQAQAQPRPLEGVVVVGFISWSPEHSSHLINRVIDCNVFGSGNLDEVLSIDTEEVKDWFKWRRISYYHDEEKGILFLQYCSTPCPALDGLAEADADTGFDSLLEDRQFEDLQGLLFMFSVSFWYISLVG